MRPINLVPGEAGRRRRTRHSTGVAPFIVLGVLAAIALASVVSVVLGNQVSSKKQQIVELTKQTRVAELAASRLERYGKFATLKQIRLTGLTTVAEARFPWGRVLGDVAKSMPKDAWLIEVVGKASPEAKTGEKTGGQASTSGSNSAGGGEEIEVPGPTLKLTGCTYRQTHLARMMSRLRNVHGVAQVLLSSSEEIEDDQASTPSENETECRTRPGIHKFTVTLTFPPDDATQLVEALRSSANPSTPPAAVGGAQPSPSSGGSTAQPVAGGASK